MRQKNRFMFIVSFFIQKILNHISHVILLFKDEPLERMNVVSTYRTTTPQIARASRWYPFPNRTSFFTTLTITCTGFQGSISFLVT